MIREVFMPALSSTMTEGKIVSWVKSPGDRVEKGETVVIVESDKADMDVESFHEGTLAAIIVGAGETAPVGEAIALLAETEDEIEAAKQQAAAKAGTGSSQATPAESATAPAPAATATVSSAASSAPSNNGASSSSQRSGRTIISPRARKLAKELKVDLSSLQGSGPHGRIVAQDIEKAAGKTPSVVQPAAPVPTPRQPRPCLQRLQRHQRPAQRRLGR
jgi:pyruvate dehydrogenase E2 component (dihydrolipoamide acetyltransferase)